MLVVAYCRVGGKKEEGGNFEGDFYTVIVREARQAGRRGLLWRRRSKLSQRKKREQLLGYYSRYGGVVQTKLVW